MSAFAGVAHLHSHGLVHSDLKPETILLRGSDLRNWSLDKDTSDYAERIMNVPQHLKVAICGLGAVRLGDPSYRCPDGIKRDELYTAPELSSGEPWSFPVDSWALGCIGAEMLLGRPILNEKEKNELLCQPKTLVEPEMIEFLGQLLLSEP